MMDLEKRMQLRSQAFRKLQQAYFEWLYVQISWPKGRGLRTYRNVCDRMNQITFNDKVPNDENRTGDGRDLRRLFFVDADLDVVMEFEDWLKGDISILEVLVAICHRANFMIDVEPPAWFGTMILNLGLHKFGDSTFRPQDTFKVDRILRKMNDRTYSPQGKGGLFPLKLPNADQRTTEIWYQMAGYMTENGLY